MKKSNLLLIFVLIFGSCDCAEEPLVEVLGNPCYIGYEGNIIELAKSDDLYAQLNTGICHTGKTDKDNSGNIICVGYVQPELEECNGLDDNCDGLVDQDLNGLPLYRPYYSQQNTCTGPGVCRYADQECISGMWTCQYPSNYGEEKCDGRDNDCDGETDEEPIFSDDERYFYTADPETINVGECRAGYKECVNGIVSIRNMRTPIPEICGNDDDDDCDGYTDERENDSEQNDFALIIDYSGSMSNIIESVADALCDWSSQGVLQNSRFAVIAIGYIEVPYDSREMKVLTDFTDAGTACDIIRQNNRQQYSGGNELQLNATFNASDPTAVEGYISWTNSRKKVLIFTDEIMQQDFRPTVEEAIEIVVQQCTTEGYIIGAFVDYNTPDQALWVDLTQSCGGFIDYLSSNPQQMINTLNYWIGSDC